MPRTAQTGYARRERRSKHKAPSGCGGVETQLPLRLAQAIFIGHQGPRPVEGAAQGIAQARGSKADRRRTAETTGFRAAHGRKIQVGQLVEKSGRLGTQPPVTGQPGRGTNLARLDTGQHLQSQEIAGETQILIAGVLDPDQSVLLGIGL